MSKSPYIAGAVIAALVAPPAIDAGKAAYDSFFHGNRGSIELKLSQAPANPLERMLGGVANANQSEDLKIASDNLIEGDRLRKEGKYNDAIDLLTKAMDIYSRQSDKLALEGNYGATLISLADSYINWTLESHFNNHKTLENSLQRLEKGIKLAKEGIKDMEEYGRQGEAQEKESKGFISWAYNLLGKATKYSGDPEKAKDYYNLSLIFNPSNDSAKFNLNHVYENFNVFIK